MLCSNTGASDARSNLIDWPCGSQILLYTNNYQLDDIDYVQILDQLSESLVL